MFELKDIPITSNETYISGIQALNLDVEEGTSPDWHFYNIWHKTNKPLLLYGKNQETNTNMYLGNYGIKDRGYIFDNMNVHLPYPVFVANHIRALADLVFYNLIKYKQIGYAKGATNDFFVIEKHNDEFCQLIMNLYPHFEEDEQNLLKHWIHIEFKSQYKFYFR